MATRRRTSPTRSASVICLDGVHPTTCQKLSHFLYGPRWWVVAQDKAKGLPFYAETLWAWVPDPAAAKVASS